MNDDRYSHSAFERYIRWGEPENVVRAENWQTAIGLQEVDGLRIHKTDSKGLDYGKWAGLHYVRIIAV